MNPNPSHRLTDEELRARVNEFTEDDPPPYGIPASVGIADADFVLRWLQQLPAAPANIIALQERALAELAALRVAAHRVANAAGYAELPLIDALAKLSDALEETLR